ncbi:CAP domain-containing protein [Brachyspira innocens]|uniref:CAP domain-containing protein n=1 Tax=Brachyspira innocens TaxID=13264 RepID=A0ABT8YZ35_9SPIR|nr:CAP domain-containing protein [Brachyspira innocens]MDO7021141.1 CAP domain-containing protein [Brachyspira innocens]
MFKIMIKALFILYFCSMAVLYSEDNYEAETTLKALNEVRENEGLYPFELSDELNKAANIRAKELSINFSHIRPNNTRYDEILYENRIRVFSSDENIAYRFKNAETVISYWMNSSQYKLNILSDKFTHVGVSHYAINGEDFWVVIFAQLRRMN